MDSSSKLLLQLLRSTTSAFFFSLFFSPFFFFPTKVVSQPSFLYNFCLNNGNFTRNSTYATNLNNLLQTLPSGASTGGFYSSSVGQTPDRANAIAMCRGDIEMGACRSCVNDSIALLPSLCPNQMDAVGWYDNCMLRYSNTSISGTATTSPKFFMWNPGNVSGEQHDISLGQLLRSLKDKAASGGSRLKFATGDANVSNFQNIYALVQCTPDLSSLSCSNCIEDAINDIPNCCSGRPGGRVVDPSCSIRFESYLFYSAASTGSSPPPPPTATPPAASNPGGKSSNTKIVVIALVASAVALGILLLIFVLCIRTRRLRFQGLKSIEDDDIVTAESLQFDFETIRVATDNFSSINKLGQGGFGAVYKGMLPNGEEIAVKRLSAGSGQGDLEFKNEVLLVAKLQHRNLARLLGFSILGSERLLVYEFLPNSSLDHHLFDEEKRLNLNWEKRQKIMGGIARGLLYLHEDSRLRIIHRDLKASNILLDVEMNAKISDFGMAKLVLLDQTQNSTSRIVGTYGYMAPEYQILGQFSVKSDVFSFGVLVLEMVTGQKNSNFQIRGNMRDLMGYVWQSWKAGKALEVVDEALLGGEQVREMLRCIHIALLCVQESAADRPTMEAVVLMLSSHSLSLPLPAEPPYVLQTTRLIVRDKADNSASSDMNHPASGSVNSSNNVTVTTIYPR